MFYTRENFTNKITKYFTILLTVIFKANFSASLDTTSSFNCKKCELSSNSKGMNLAKISEGSLNESLTADTQTSYYLKDF